MKTAEERMEHGDIGLVGLNWASHTSPQKQEQDSDHRAVMRFYTALAWNVVVWFPVFQALGI